jgi:Zn-finger nucleic acid-binding protein
MHCLRCDDAYLESTYLGATAVDRCPACMGHWFARGELAAFLKSPTVGYFADQYATFKIPAVRVTRAPACPGCGVTLKRARPAQLSQAAVDVCSRCGGTWLDGVELQRVLVTQIKGKSLVRQAIEIIEQVVGLPWKTR